jgi:hypothetical protein
MAAAIKAPTRQPCASAKKWGDHWILNAQMYYRSSASDRDSYGVILKDPIDDQTLGRHLRAALAASRMLTLEETALYFEPNASKERYERWVQWCMQGTGATKRRALFKGFRSCSCRVRTDGILEIAPYRRQGAEGWVGLGRETVVSCPISSPDDELGRTLRVAMERAEA